MAEAFVRRLTLGLPVAVESFGTLQLGAAPGLPEAHELGLWWGLDLSRHGARLLGTESLEQTDLLIGFEEGHVRRAVIDCDAPHRRSFTFRDIVALLEDVQNLDAQDVVQRARHAVEQAAASREASPESVRGEPIRDPFGRSWRVYRETATEIRELSLELVDSLFGVRGAGEFPPLPAKLSHGLRRRR